MAIVKFRQSMSRHDDSDDSYFISISDLMASLIFFFIITIVVLIINYQSAIKAHTDKRIEILQSLQKEFDIEGIPVTLDYDEGSMRLPEKILFKVGESTLTDQGVQNVGILANKLFESAIKYRSSLDAILIEGHADNSTFKNSTLAESELKNLNLSVRRAIETYRVLKLHSTELCELENPQGQRILSVSGYGQYRPVNEHYKPTEDPENRRIEIRFVMTPAERLVSQSEIKSESEN